MSDVVEKINLVKSDPELNNNKFWRGTLFSNGDVLCEWGRVGDTGQKKMFPGKGRSFLEKKVNDKKRAGRNGEIAYRECDVIDSVDAPSPKPNMSHSTKNTPNLAAIAKKQIRSKSSEAMKFIDYLVKVNAHQIASATNNQITYNYDTGLFQTPLGIVVQTNIDEARIVLNTIADLVDENDFGNRLMEQTRNLLMLVPQNLGRRKLLLPVFWGVPNQVQKQNAILDGLQSSLAQATTPKAKPSDKKIDEPEEQVFDTELDLIEDKKIVKILFDNFYNTRSSVHPAYKRKPKQAWTVNIGPMRDAWKKRGSKMDNLIEGYHGSNEANILSLLKSGVMVTPPSSAKVAGKMFGSGAYTAPCHVKGSSTKALNYSMNVWTGGGGAGRFFMFVCDVAMGKFHIPNGPINRVPSGFDSCWAKGNHRSGVMNDECIVYSQHQIDMKYLIEFE